MSEADLLVIIKQKSDLGRKKSFSV